MVLLKTLNDHLSSKGISKIEACKIFGRSNKTLKRWNDDPPAWALNIIQSIDKKRNIPNSDSWSGFIFNENKLILPNGDYLTANDILSLRFEQMNRTAMGNNPETIYILKNELENKLKLLDSTITINLENSGEVLKSWKVSI